MGLNVGDHAVRQTGFFELNQSIRTGVVVAWLKLNRLDEHIVAQTCLRHTNEDVIVDRMRFGNRLDGRKRICGQLGSLRCKPRRRSRKADNQQPKAAPRLTATEAHTAYANPSASTYSTMVKVYILPELARLFPVFIVLGGRNPYSPGANFPATVMLYVLGASFFDSKSTVSRSAPPDE